MPDAELAKRLGRSVVAVAIRRRLKRRPYVAAQRRFWTKRQIRLLGRYPDSEVARRLKRTRASVTSERRRLGVPGCLRKAKRQS